MRALLSQGLVLSFLGLMASTAGAQTNTLPDTADYPYWIEMMQDQDANFFETQRAFNRYWEGRAIEKGSGWKVFKRWEALMESRVNADGSRPDPALNRDEYLAFKAQEQTFSSGNRSTIGDWTELGPITMPANGTGQPNGLGRLNNIAFHPTDANYILVGAPAGGLWKTTNGGSSWTTNTDDLATLGVSSILIDYGTPNTQYIGTGDRDGGDAPGLGVYKSTDGGANWNTSNTGMGNKTVGAMVMHPTNSQIILATTNDGIFKTTNAGSAWTQTAPNLDHYKDIRYQPGNPNIVYSTAQGDFYRSTDGGDSYVQITSGLPSNCTRYSIGVSPANSNYVYLLGAVGSTFLGFYRSTDGGLTFTQQSNSPNILNWSTTGTGTGGQAWYDLCLAVDPNDANTVYTGGINIWKSTDGGVNWTISAHWVGNSTIPSVHADHHWLEYSPVDGRLYNCNDGGLYYSDDGGNTWPEISSGLAISQLYRIGQSATNADLIINGYQDNGTAIYDGGWRTEIGGDGMECIVDPTDENYLYGSLYFGAIRRSTNNGLNFGNLAGQNVNGITESGAWVTPFMLHEDDPNTMFVGFKNVWRSTNVKAGTGVTWTKISDNLAGNNSQNCRDLKQSRANSDKLYMARHDSKFFRTDDCMAATPTWIDLTSSLPNNADVIDIETHPYLPNVVYIIQSNRVYVSTNSGASWTEITGNLPGGYKGCMVLDQYSHEGLYVGTDAGVYYTDSTQANWVSFDDGMPVSSRINELELYYDPQNFNQSRIRAATYGRGVWSSDLYALTTIAPLANFQADITEPSLCDQDTVTLGDYSAYIPNSWLWTITPSTFTYVNGTNASSQVPQLVFQQSGNYTIKLVVSNAIGSDSITKNNYITANGGIPPTYLEDFESFADCGTNNCTQSCGMMLDWINQPNGSADDIDWRPHFGTTPSGTTGPTVDYIPGTATGIYLYTEASFCFDNTALLESPCLDLTESTDARLRYAYHMDGFSMGELHFDVKDNGTWDQDIAPFKTGDLGAPWNTDSLDLSAYQGKHVRVRFRGITGPNYSSDMAIDGIGLVAAPLADFAADDETPCLDQAVTLSDLSSQNPTGWAWSIAPNTFNFLNGTNANSQHPQVEFTSEGTYSISLISTNQYGSHSVVKSNYVTVAHPNATISSNVGNDLCLGDSASFAGPVGYVNYAFNWNGGIIQNGGANQWDGVNFLNGDVIFISITDSNGCISESDTLNMVVYPLPQPVLQSSDDDDELCSGDPISFTETNGAAQFDFYADTTLMQSGPSNQWTTDSLQDGESVSVFVIDSNGCEGTSNAIATTVLPTPMQPSVALNLGQDSLNAVSGGTFFTWYLGDSLLPYKGAVIPWVGYGVYSAVAHGGECISDTTYFDWGSTGFQLGGSPFKMNVFPNPSRGSFNLKLEGLQGEQVEVMVTDASGRTIYARKLGELSNAYNHAIDLEGVGSGLFQLEVRVGKELHVEKLLFVK